MEYLTHLSSYELVTLAALLSFYISQDLTIDEVNTLGSFFSALGQNLSTIADTSNL